MPPSSASARVTTGLKCAPEMDPKVRIKAMRAAPVASVLANKARALLPPDRFWAMIPEPTMVASRKALPRPSAVARFARGAIEAMRIDLSQQKLKLESHKRTFTTRQER